MDLSVRRKADPLSAQKIWDAIKHYNGLKQFPRSKQVAKFCKQKYSMEEEEVESELQNMIEDGLVIVKPPSKGVSKGLDQHTYHIPTDSEMSLSSDHDWYCFQCHKGGPVLACSTCHRVYHPNCLEGYKIESNFECSSCEDVKNGNSCKMPRRKMTKMLTFVCDNIKDTMPGDIRVWNPEASSPVSAALTTDRGAVLQNKKQRQGSKSAPADPWRYKLLIHPLNQRELNLDTMKSRADRMVYRKIQQFQLDAATIVHNVVIFHGNMSVVADAARQMHRECNRELEEMIHCPDCYQRSHEKEKTPDWFCRPCRPPHSVAFARQKGYPYWPAKVIRTEGNVYDVRFFGSKHERAKVDQACIRPITTSIQSLVMKRSALWNKAWDEFQTYQKMLDEPLSEDSASSDDEINSDTKKQPLITKELRVVIERLDPSLLESLSRSASFSPPCKKKKNDQFVELNKEIQLLKQRLAEKNLEIHKLKRYHEIQLVSVKKKQWCSNCEQEALMNCCWNVSYCSHNCQLYHWTNGHKKNCKRRQ